MQVVKNLDLETWRQFVADHPHGNIFHTPEMFQVFAQAKGHHPELWAVAGHKNQILALILPVQITLINGLLRRLTTRSIVYGSVLCSAEPEGQAALKMLLQGYKQQKNDGTLFTELRNLSDLSDIQPNIQGCGFVYEDHLNFLINLALPVEQVWENINKSARKNIKKALNKQQLVIEEVNDLAQVKLCHTLLQETYGKAQIPLADLSLFEAIFNILYPKGMAKFFLGQVNDTYIAASVVLLYKQIVFGWYRGFNRAYASYLPNDLMVWDLLKWGAENNYHTFDFGGAGRPNEPYGPREFKAKFGGKLVNYGRNTYVHTPTILKLSELGYQLYRRWL